MSITNAVIENWRQNRDNFLKLKQKIRILGPLFMQFCATKNWDKLSININYVYCTG